MQTKSNLTWSWKFCFGDDGLINGEHYFKMNYVTSKYEDLLSSLKEPFIPAI